MIYLGQGTEEMDKEKVALLQEQIQKVGDEIALLQAGGQQEEATHLARVMIAQGELHLSMYYDGLTEEEFTGYRTRLKELVDGV